VEITGLGVIVSNLGSIGGGGFKGGGYLEGLVLCIVTCKLVVGKVPGV